MLLGAPGRTTRSILILLVTSLLGDFRPKTRTDQPPAMPSQQNPLPNRKVDRGQSVSGYDRSWTALRRTVEGKLLAEKDLLGLLS